ncbi:hypothetical protein GCM10007424_20840 [Flavobacterium suaedae]|uniref:Uncharacterized protein n=1 Tax=Flavobacterium suaedae TaxID=1767027 RepID=A0ABQ1JXP7_9FLAO|nr:hypothetical protein GCM10007424_20840 [Flavobacterium suaedae]
MRFPITFTERIIVSLEVGYNDQDVPLYSNKPSLLAKYIKLFSPWLTIQFWLPAPYVVVLYLIIGGKSCDKQGVKNSIKNENRIFFNKTYMNLVAFDLRIYRNWKLIDLMFEF